MRRLAFRHIIIIVVILFITQPVFNLIILTRPILISNSIGLLLAEATRRREPLGRPRHRVIITQRISASRVPSNSLLLLLPKISITRTRMKMIISSISGISCIIWLPLLLPP